MRRNLGEAQRPTFRRPLGRQFRGVGAEPPPPTPEAESPGCLKAPGSSVWAPRSPPLCASPVAPLALGLAWPSRHLISILGWVGVVWSKYFWFSCRGFWSTSMCFSMFHNFVNHGFQSWVSIEVWLNLAFLWECVQYCFNYGETD